jgi:hypothetical protein
LSAWTRASLALVLVVVVASAAIRLSERDLGAWMGLVRGAHRASASLATLTILVVAWLAWRAGRRGLALALVAVTAALSILGAATGIDPPPAAAAGNLLGGLLLAGLLAAVLSHRGGALYLTALGGQILLGAWLGIFADELWSWTLLAHALLGVALAGLTAALALKLPAARERLALLLLAIAVPSAGAAAALFGLPLGATLAHATAAAFLVVAAARLRAHLV